MANTAASMSAALEPEAATQSAAEGAAAGVASVGVQGCPSETAQAGTASVCQGCPGQALCSSGVRRVPADQPDLETRMRVIRHKLLVVAGKGGVGKSSVASMLSTALLKARGRAVAVLDVDICGPSVPRMFGVEHGRIHSQPWGWVPVKEPTHQMPVMSVGFMLGASDQAVIWRGPRKTATIRRMLKDTFWGKLDYLVVDTPPGTSDEHLTIVAALANSTECSAVIVTQPQDLALTTVRKELSFCQKMGIRVIGVVENMSEWTCPCCGHVEEVFGPGGGAALAAEFSLPFLGRIPLDPAVGAACDAGQCPRVVCADSPTIAAVDAVAEAIDRILCPADN